MGIVLSKMGEDVAMTKENDARDFDPALAIAPGETIKEEMEHRGISQRELADILDISYEDLGNILDGNAPITYEIATKLEGIFGPSKDFWISLEIGYQLDNVINKGHKG